MARSGKKILQRFRVPLGFLFGIVFLVFAKPNAITIASGFAVAFFGLAIRAWSAGHIRKNRELADSGPYAFTRNPLYLGSFVMSLGACIGSGRWWIVLLFLGLFAGIYLPVMSVEADELKEIFGDEYSDYAARVPLFFPGFRSAEKSSKKFEMGLYLRYREYRAAIGVLFVFLILAAKAYFEL